MSLQHRVIHRVRVEPYWGVMLLLALTGALLYLDHLATGWMPDRVALHIAALNFDIYWYGVIIVGGIGLGAWLVTALVMKRARAIMEQTVPASLRAIPVKRLKLPAEINAILARNGITTTGDLLLQWGLNPGRTGLNRKGREQVQQLLEGRTDISPAWFDDTPWRPWDPDHVWAGLMWCLVFAVIGARLYHVLTPSPSMASVGIRSAADYFRQPLQLVNVRSGGLGIYGGLAGGALGLALYTARQRLPLLLWADFSVIGLALGQAVGRWGNFFNQELYGRPSNLPWAVTIAPDYRLSGYTDVARFHPAFLYESGWNFLAFLVLYWLARRRAGKLRSGDLTAIYLIFYAAGRILLEFVRLDSATIILAQRDTHIPIASGVSFLLILFAAGWMMARRKRAAAAFRPA